MNARFYIVDDDRSVRKILSKIIIDHNLGRVVGEAEDGTTAKHEIIALEPDIALIDLLLPVMDGITMAGLLKSECPQVSLVMLSEVTDKEMVAKAYKAGVDLFIHKPINVIEVVSVIGQVQEQVRMRKVIQSLRTAIGGLDHFQTNSAALPPADSSAARPAEEDLRRQIKAALAKLGIFGESGGADIIEICIILLTENQGLENGWKIKKLYAAAAKKLSLKQKQPVNAASVEQRIRRAVGKALNNTANMGLEDYGNEFFVTFSGSFFDFTEVRRQMNYIRGQSTTPGKINVKKFIEGMILQIQNK